jgi:hypothetical protein
MHVLALLTLDGSSIPVPLPLDTLCRCTALCDLGICLMDPPPHTHALCALPCPTLWVYLMPRRLTPPAVGSLLDHGYISLSPTLHFKIQKGPPPLSTIGLR